jgi:hypothetical protein
VAGDGARQDAAVLEGDRDAKLVGGLALVDLGELA